MQTDTRATDHIAVRGMYVHVPFCHSICGYCDFYSEVLDRKAASPLVDALLMELERALPHCDLAVESIFVGGGTPTTLPPDDLRRLLRRLDDTASGQPRRTALEFTVEANPATVTPEIAQALADSGVNRVSIGAQSFALGELAVLERLHRPEQVSQTLENCRAVGITNLNLDLIFGIPGQSLPQWLANLQRAIDLAPRHLSCYGLTYERGTPLFDQLRQGRIRRVDEETEAQMFDATIDTLAAAGFRQYEISNYAQSGAECRHNRLYWCNESHLALGPSAAGLVNGVRYRNVPDTAAYVRAIREGKSTRIEEEHLDNERRMRESAMLELRLIDGIDRRRFMARYGADPLELFAEECRRHVAAGLLESDERGIRLTRAGLLLADTVIADFL